VIAALVNAMLTSCGQLATIFDHMERHRDGRPDAEVAAIVLAGMLEEILATLQMSHVIDDIATATRVLSGATDLVASELFRVADSPSKLNVAEPPSNRTTPRRHSAQARRALRAWV